VRDRDSLPQALRQARAGTLSHVISPPPEILVLLVSGAAWALLAARPHTTDWAAICATTSGGGWKRIDEIAITAWQLGAAREAMVDWGLMALAMVPVLAVPMVRFVAARSFAERRTRAVSEFLMGSLAVWMVAGVVLLPVLVMGALPDATHATAAAAAFGLAALWQVAPPKRAALERCHRTTALTANGWRADRDCVVLGAESAIHCVISCWAMMLACAVSQHSLAALLLVQGITMHERATQAPVPSRYALLLALCAVAAAIGLMPLP